MKINEKINVGHIPIELSSSLASLLNMEAKVRQESYRASNLEQGGLEVPTLYCLHVLLFTARYPIRKDNSGQD